METPGLTASTSGRHDPPLAQKTVLSLSQREVWLDQLAWPHSVHLNIGGGGFLHGRVDLELLKASLTQLVAENAALRLVPCADASQTLLSRYEPELQFVDLGHGDDHDQSMRNWWLNHIRVPFELGREPPWRFAILRVRDDLHGVLMQFHHLVMDGWGTSRVMQRWSDIYNARRGHAACPPVNEPGYLKFIEESNHYRNSEAFSRDEHYWLQQFETVPTRLMAPRSRIHHDAALPDAHLIVKRIPRHEYNLLKHHCDSHGLSVFNVFLAGLCLYFARVANRQEVVVGVPHLNRTGRRYRETLGMFVGVMPVLVSLSRDMTCDDLVAAVGAVMRGALRHPRYPLSELSRKLELLQSGQDSLFDVLLSFERQDYQLKFGDAQSISSRQMFSGLARYPLSVTVCEFHDHADVELILEASPHYFTAPEARLLADRLWGVVNALTAQPAANVWVVPVTAPAETAALVDTAHAIAASGQDAQPFIASFERWAILKPGSVALVWDNGTLDYGTLNARAEHLCGRLVALGAAPGAIVAFAIERCADMVVAVLAIAKTGAAFLPLDADSPVARLVDILSQSKAVALLVQPGGATRLGDLHPRTLVVDHETVLEAQAAPARPAVPTPCDVAYVLFTSGSTGKPKGVMVEHRALSLRLAWLSRTYDVRADDRSAQATQITFDPSLIELCLPLIHGASIALPPPGRLLPESLADFAVKHGVTIMAFVPSTLSRFLDAVPDRDSLQLRVACCGGEVLSPELANRFLRQTRARLYNVYGPTEATIFATAWECLPQPPGAALPIGKPVDSTRIYLLDAQRQMLPMGVAGEIYISGDTVARGYVNRIDLMDGADSVFVDDPFVPGARMYRTGDRGRFDTEGHLHFLGRLDRQVKLRGYRIELGEIEAALLGIDGVTQAAVQLIDNDGKPTIHAWVASLTISDSEPLQRVLRQRLPSYMIPSGIQVLRALPHSAVGKIDYGALPAPQPARPADSVREPQSDLERNLLSLWRDTLRQPDLRVTDNFFETGGDSLAAISILSGVEKLIGRRVPMYLITERPTVEGLACALSEDTADSGLLVQLHRQDAPVSDVSAVKPVRPALFLAASGHGDLMRFKNLAYALAATCDVHMLQPPSASTITRTVDLAKLYVTHVQKHGGRDCYIAGFSVGGLAALETAHQLKTTGVDVKALYLLDTIYPSRLWGGTLLWRVFGWMVRVLPIKHISMNGRRLDAMVNDTGLFGQVLAVSGYRPSKYLGATHLIKSMGLATFWDGLLFSGWRKPLGSHLVEHTVKGLHGSMFDGGKVDELAQVIGKSMVRQQPNP